MNTNVSVGRIVTDRDFLLGSVWEGTGDELHTNRHAARSSMYGQRVLSGISGMLVALHAVASDLVWAAQTCVEWSFDAPLFEDALVEVRVGDHNGGRAFTVLDGPSVRSRGLLCPATLPATLPAGSRPAQSGRRTRGRTMTRADVALLRHWLPPESDVPDDLVPWPLLLLTASGLVVRDKAHGDVELSLNRWMRWVPATHIRVGDTMHCEVTVRDRRPSRSRPDLDVVRLDVDVVSSVSGERIGTVDWVMICR